jgi:hypothetical protein
MVLNTPSYGGGSDLWDEARAAPLRASTKPFAQWLVRTGRSVRFVQMTEASFRTSGPEMSVWRSAAAAAGHPVIGDSADCCDPHSKSACLWVCDVHIERSADSSSGVSVPGALPPARFDRLFEREEQVADQAARGVLKPEYLRSLLKLRPCT